MKKYSLILFFFLIVCGNAVGQIASIFSGGAHGESLAHTNSTFQGVLGLHGNIAGISFADGVAADASFDARYGLSELSTMSISGVYGTDMGTFGLMAMKYGFESYSENKIGIAYGRKLGKGLRIGGMLDVIQYQVDNYGMATKLTFEAGIYSELTDKVHLGAYFFSPSTVSLTNVQDIPSRLSFGVKYFVSPKATLIADLTKISKRDLDIKFAVDYALQERLGLRMGANITQGSFHAGTYIELTPDIRVTGGYSYHVNLGSTPSISLTYRATKRT